MKKFSKSFSNLGFPRSKSHNDLKISLTTSSTTSSSSKFNFYKIPIQLDRYLTNEGHQLVVSYLRLTEIQKNIQKGSLHKLRGKDIDELLRSYKGVKTFVFETLNYEELNLSHVECKMLAKLLNANHLTNIRVLKLTRNRLSGNPLKLILEALHKNTTVTTLDLSFNDLSDTEAKWLGKLFKKNQTLKEVNVAYNKIEGEGAHYIAEGLKANKSIERLSLESNRLNILGGKHIADMLKFNQTIKAINLGRNNLQLAGIRAISEALELNKTLVSLSLDVNNMQSDGAFHIAEALKTNSNLTHLHVAKNNIGNEGLQHICRALLQNTTLNYIDLELNNIGGGRNNDDASLTGVRSLGKLLENHVVPKAISLTSNPIGNEGCVYLFSGFHKNKTLESLILSNCGIRTEGINAISESLKINDGLQNLSLSENFDLGINGHLSLADALEKNTSLKVIQLDYNFAEWDTVGNKIQECLIRNHFLQQDKYSTACRILKASRIILNSKSSSSSKKELTQLPYEMKEQILISLDENQVLKGSEIISIIRWGTRKETLGSTMENFLTENLSAYYPLTSDVKSWPNKSVDRFEMTTENRF